MKEQIAIRNLLNKTLLEARANNPSFSIRALAKRLEMQPSATSEILKGKRKVSRKKALKITELLHLDPTEKAIILKDFPLKQKRTSKYKETQFSNKADNFLKLTSNQFELISNGIHFAILSLIKTDDFISNIDWMSKRLNQSPLKVSKALRTLESLCLIKVENKKIIRTAAPITIEDDVLNLSVQKSHLEDMEIAKQKLIKTDIKKRDYTSLTLPVDPELLPKAKEILRNAQLQLEELMEEGPQKEVYRLSMYLYPLTQTKIESIGESK